MSCLVIKQRNLIASAHQLIRKRHSLSQDFTNQLAKDQSLTSRGQGFSRISPNCVGEKTAQRGGVRKAIIAGPPNRSTVTARENQQLRDFSASQFHDNSYASRDYGHLVGIRNLPTLISKNRRISWTCQDESSPIDGVLVWNLRTGMSHLNVQLTDHCVDDERFQKTTAFQTREA